MKRTTKRVASSEWVLQITALRARLGINQAELARRLKCSAMTISRWERGLLRPSSESLIQLGNLSNKKEAWFFWEMAGIQTAKMDEALARSSRPKLATQMLRVETIGADGQALRVDRKFSVIGIPLLKAVVGSHGTAGDKRSILRSIASSGVIGVPRVWCPNPAYTSLLRVTGRSMEPTIRNADMIAVDAYPTERHELYGHLVVVTSEQHGLSVSRLRSYDGIEVLEAEDRAFEPVVLKKGRSGRIVGRVLWSISGIS